MATIFEVMLSFNLCDYLFHHDVVTGDCLVFVPPNFAENLLILLKSKYY